MKKYKKHKGKKGHTTYFTFTIPLFNTPDSILGDLQIQPIEEGEDFWDITPFQLYLAHKYLAEQEGKNEV